MTGYNGYSMSNNAVKAYSERKMPLSKMISYLKKRYPKTFKGLTSEIFKAAIKPCEYHHTSKAYNCTDLYSIFDVAEARIDIKKYIEGDKVIKDAKKAGITNATLENGTNWARLSCIDFTWDKAIERLKEQIKAISRRYNAGDAKQGASDQ